LFQRECWVLGRRQFRTGCDTVCCDLIEEYVFTTLLGQGSDFENTIIKCIQGKVEPTQKLASTPFPSRTAFPEEPTGPHEQARHNELDPMLVQIFKEQLDQFLHFDTPVLERRKSW
jgi:hypothetical protein